eukprot:gene8-10918_t
MRPLTKVASAPLASHAHRMLGITLKWLSRGFPVVSRGSSFVAPHSGLPFRRQLHLAMAMIDGNVVIKN